MKRVFTLACRRYSPLLLSLLLMVACQGLRPETSPPPSLTDTLPPRLVENICDRNTLLHAYKGIGRIAWRQDTIPGQARMAWIGQPPDRLRLEILDMTGRPALTLSTDGDYFYVLQHVDNHFERADPALVDLSDFISIDIPITDIIRLMGGQMPFSESDCRAGDISFLDDSMMLAIQPGLLSRRYRVNMNATGTGINGLEVYTPFGKMAYRADLTFRLCHHTYYLPENMILSNTQGDFFKLHAERWWVDMPVNEAIFTLNPPD